MTNGEHYHQKRGKLFARFIIMQKLKLYESGKKKKRESKKKIERTKSPNIKTKAES